MMTPPDVGAVRRLGAEIRQDVTFGLRLIRRSPGFSLVATLTLALGIGANTAIVSVLNALLMRPLPIAAPDAVMRIDTGQSQASWPNYEDLRDRNRVFSAVAAHRMLAASLVTVVHAGREPDDHARVDRDDEVMAAVLEELERRVSVQRIVERVGIDVVEHVSIGWPEESDLHGSPTMPTEAGARVSVSLRRAPGSSCS